MYQPVDPMSPTAGADGERTPLLGSQPNSSSRNTGDDGPDSHDDSRWTLGNSTRRLYVSHFLSTCNTRVFEFGSVLYLASIFPGTLLPMSVYAMVRGASAIVLSSLVGQYIDREDRLKVVRRSIGEAN